MRKKLVTLTALLATAGLAFSFFHFSADAPQAPDPHLRLIRVQAAGQDPALWSWLRKEASRFEIETGTRVYLRTAPMDSAASLEGGVPPDLLISMRGDETVALQGFALFYRDDAAVSVTPRPTSFLFVQPSSKPAPSLLPEPTKSPPRFSTVLAPASFLTVVPNAILSSNPLQDLIDGKGNAAILTAGQAERLPFQAGIQPLAGGNGFLPISASVLSPNGETFLRHLLSASSQRALADVGLFSPLYRLYRGVNPWREAIESTLQ